MVCCIEDAGFEVRDMIAWMYGSGFPKSLDVSKAIDKEMGVEREVVGTKIRGDVEKAKTSGVTLATAEANKNNKAIFGYGVEEITLPTSPEAKQWAGFGTALKPSFEPISLSRKPLEGTVAQNVLEYGTGVLNIDGTRIPTDEDPSSKRRMAGFKKNDEKAAVSEANGKVKWRGDPAKRAVLRESEKLGRWPANVIHDGSEEVEAGMPESKDGVAVGRNASAGRVYGGGKGLISQDKGTDSLGYNGSGSASRFFYCAKASRTERGKDNKHPTVKPIALMRYLVKLVTPPGGRVLDPFAGSGSTGVACMMEGFRFVGIELEEEYIKTARERIQKAYDNERSSLTNAFRTKVNE
jgi:site-specific DNA-methyltransferase (adenine-specific)